MDKGGGRKEGEDGKGGRGRKEGGEDGKEEGRRREEGGREKRNLFTNFKEKYHGRRPVQMYMYMQIHVRVLVHVCMNNQ